MTGVGWSYQRRKGHHMYGTEYIEESGTCCTEAVHTHPHNGYFTAVAVGQEI